jgi:hypothetical protein
MMNTPQLAASLLGVALCDTAWLAARLFILARRNRVWIKNPPQYATGGGFSIL